MKIPSPALGNPEFAIKVAKSTAMTVYLMTGVKATVRPLFNLHDKKSDKDSRKYSAMNEFLYQIVCLGIAAAMIPFCEAAGFKIAEKNLSKIAEKFGQKAENIKGFEKLAKVKGIGLSGSKKIKQFKDLHLKHSFDETHVNTLNQLKKAKKDGQKLTDLDEKILQEEEAEHFINGGIEAGSLAGSILGLTLLAPMISHKILHPIMHVMGMGKEETKKDENPALYKLQQPIASEAHHKVSLNA